MLIFGKWDINEVVSKDLGIAKYTCFKGKEVPHTYGSNKSTLVEKAKFLLLKDFVIK